MTETTLDVTGMSCGNCKKHVTAALLGVPGVTAAEVDLEAHRAVVTHDLSRAPVAALIAAVEAAGYEASQPVAVAPGAPGV
jgi:copper chaperone CopZ